MSHKPFRDKPHAHQKGLHISQTTQVIKNDTYVQAIKTGQTQWKRFIKGQIYKGGKKKVAVLGSSAPFPYVEPPVPRLWVWVVKEGEEDLRGKENLTVRILVVGEVGPGAPPRAAGK